VPTLIPRFLRSKPLPTKQPEASYLSSVTVCLQDLFGAALVGVYVGGSYALGDYRRGRSDLDLAGVVESRVPARLRELAIERLLPEAARCPTRGLELVIYRSATVRSGSVQPDFELNLNAGPGMPVRVDHGTAAAGQGHWFPIDRSILAQAGMPLLGPPAGEVFSPIAPKALVPVLVDSIRWHRAHPERPSDSVLNACRSLRFATEGRWSSKSAAGRWAVNRGLAPSELVRRACAGELGPSRELVDEFLAEVESRLSAPEGSGPPC
jgi:aminoglycoside adenylyltransferase-like protein/nucleotidyltransferase-like protein